MSIKRIISVTLFLALMALGVNASVLDSIRFDARLGYALGGTIPTHIGKEIRGINSYYPGFNFTVAAEVSYPLSQQWSLHSGLRG